MISSDFRFICTVQLLNGSIYMPPSLRKTAITVVSFKKSLTLCIAHYLNTKQDSGWVVTLAGYGPANSALKGR